MVHYRFMRVVMWRDHRVIYAAPYEATANIYVITQYIWKYYGVSNTQTKQNRPYFVYKW